MSSRQIAALGVSLLSIGCNQRLVLPVVAGSAAGTSSSAGTQGAVTSSNSGSSASGGTSGSGSTSGTGAPSGTSTGNTGIATTGGTTGASPYVDGGYVTCSAAGGDGGAYWMCQAGSYICAQSASGNCLQCLSDRDCADQSLPTYDPNRPRCDMDSGVVGYQNFCQQCVSNADCASNAAGTLCDLNPSYPPAGLQPGIENTGFETCTRVQTDCRVDGGPSCRGYNQFCNPDDGQCATRSSACKSDQDCVGVFSPNGGNLPAPFCMGGTCSSCDGGGDCFELGSCIKDADCGNPTGSPSGLTCDLTTYRCICKSSSQCDAFWPVCRAVDAGGQVETYCGCTTNADCGDAGLVCLSGPFSGSFAGVCAVPCTSPLAQACSPYVCNTESGGCVPCTGDAQCQADPSSGGPICTLDPPLAFCGCNTNGDCPAGEVCQGPSPLRSCKVELTRCTPGSCGNAFCDWDSGNCVPPVSPEGPFACITDYDCANQLGSNSRAPFCQDGSCVMCRSNADCLHSGLASEGGSMCCLPGDKVCSDRDLPSNTCESVCASDQDCIGNYYGPSCTVGDAGLGPRCGCASDADCAGNAAGLHCDREPGSLYFGSCSCQADSDCAGGLACGSFIGDTSECYSSCYADGGCAPGYTCDPNAMCRPRCDPGHGCVAPDLSCDQLNQVGQNGSTNAGFSSSVVWCYGCLQPDDCVGGVGCDPERGCGYCRQSSDCPSGKACVDGGVCQPMCEDGGCPFGQVCDAHGLAGNGADVCLGCVSSADCPNGEGCDSATHSCGTCEGPTAEGGPFDCPPDALCSNFWKPTEPWVGQSTSSGVCLTNCDRQSCPADQPLCAVLPGLTPDHKYCFGCLADSDCTSLGASAYCNVSPAPTFTCRLPAGQ